MGTSNIGTFLIQAVIVILGWFVVHYFSKKRDRENRRADLRTQYLITTFRKLSSLSGRNISIKPYCETAGDVVFDIQLLGTPEQIELLDTLLDQYQRADEHGVRRANLDPLLNKLGEDLRKEFDMPIIEGRNYRWFRPEGADPKIIETMRQKPPENSR